MRNVHEERPWMNRQKKAGRRTRNKGRPLFPRRGTFFPKGVSALLFVLHVDSSSVCQFRMGYIQNQLCVPAAIVFRELTFRPTGT